MTVIEALAAELKQECAITRRLLERLPDDKFAWKPHVKSMSLGQLASHIAETPSWVGHTFAQDVLDIDPATFKPWLAADRAELLAAFDKHVAGALEVLQAQPDAILATTWTMSVKGQTVFSESRAVVLRMFIYSHLIHHRGQLSVYLRLNDIPVPSIYGPSADEQSL